jgi:hypothetical protein
VRGPTAERRSMANPQCEAKPGLGPAPDQRPKQAPELAIASDLELGLRLVRVPASVRVPVPVPASALALAPIMESHFELNSPLRRSGRPGRSRL